MSPYSGQVFSNNPHSPSPSKPKWCIIYTLLFFFSRSSQLWITLFQLFASFYFNSFAVISHTSSMLFFPFFSPPLAYFSFTIIIIGSALEEEKEDTLEEASNMEFMKQCMNEGYNLECGMWLDREIWRRGIGRCQQTLWNQYMN